MRDRVGVLLLLLAVSCTPAGERNGEATGLDDYRWLLGSYHGSGEGIEFFERYRLEDDSTFAIDYFTDSTMTELQPVTGSVVARGGEIYHTYGPMRWRAVERTPDALRFEPDTLAENRFDWVREGDGEWHAVLFDRDAEGRERSQRYVLSQVQR